MLVSWALLSTATTSIKALYALLHAHEQCLNNCFNTRLKDRDQSVQTIRQKLYLDDFSEIKILMKTNKNHVIENQGGHHVLLFWQF